MKKRIIIFLLIICAIIFLLEFTPLNLSQFTLSAAQKENMLNEIIDVDPDDWGDEEFKNSAVVASMDIFGITGFGNERTVYGYLDEGLYVEANGRGYEVSGGLFEFMVDIKIDGDDVTVIENHGDGVSTQSTLDEMPFNYRCKWFIYVGLGFEQRLLDRTQKKVIDKLGVPADRVNTLDIDDEKGIYEIYDMDLDDNIIVEYRGHTSELYK